MVDDLSSGALGDCRAMEGEIIVFGQNLLKSGHVEEALKFFRRMARLFPESPAICACLGEVYLARGELKRARTSFARSEELGLECDPDPNEPLDAGGAR